MTIEDNEDSRMMRMLKKLKMRGRLVLHEKSAKEGAGAFPDAKEETPHQTHHLDCNDDNGNDDDKKKLMIMMVMLNDNI